MKELSQINQSMVLKISEVDIYEKENIDVRKNIGFRSWFYFRTGWSMYFAFILSAVNTLTVTYYLAIEQIPFLKEIFPSFLHYVITFVMLGVPILITTGLIHFKKTSARKAEVDISVETNPYQLRNLVNSEMILLLNMKLARIIFNSEKGEKISESDLKELKILLEKSEKFLANRTVAKERDLEFFREINSSGKL